MSGRTSSFPASMRRTSSNVNSKKRKRRTENTAVSQIRFKKEETELAVPAAAAAPSRSKKKAKPGRWAQRTTSLSCPVRTFLPDLRAIWKARKQMPTAESRRVWALARNINPAGVHRFFTARCKAEDTIPGKYDLDVGNPELRLGDSVKQEVKEEPASDSAATIAPLPPPYSVTISALAAREPPVVTQAQLSSLPATFIQDASSQDQVFWTPAPGALTCSYGESQEDPNVEGGLCALCAIRLPGKHISWSHIRTFSKRFLVKKTTTRSPNLTLPFPELSSQQCPQLHRQTSHSSTPSMCPFQRPLNLENYSDSLHFLGSIARLI